MNAKTILISVLVVGAVGAFVMYQIFNGNQALPPAAPAQGYKDGQYTGSAVGNNYGSVQVEATISGTKITDVQFLQYPNGSGHSQQVSSFAMPQLTQEAIQAQSARVNIVSGATQTSQAFIQSLASALSQAS